MNYLENMIQEEAQVEQLPLSVNEKLEEFEEIKKELIKYEQK